MSCLSTISTFLLTVVAEPRKNALRHRNPRKTATWPQSQPADESAVEEDESGPTDAALSSYPTHALTLSRSRDHYREPAPDVHQSFDTLDTSRLLMPPPSTTAETIRRNFFYLLSSLAEVLNLANVWFLARVGIFVIKLVALHRSCWPFMATLEVSVPLLLLAALDLRFPGTSPLVSQQVDSSRQSFYHAIVGGAISLGLFWVHFAAIYGATTRNVLCVVNERHDGIQE
jgi:hypothetical protein